jgi:nitroreductase
VPRPQLIEILETARAAPSNFNSQPWRVYLLTDEAKRALGQALVRAHNGNTVPSFSPFPQPMPPDCGARVAGRARQTGRNFVFFDAPVGMIFTIHEALTKHSWLDFGLFLQTLILAAQVRGLATCPQVSFVRFQSVIAEQLDLDPEEMVTCGMSLGYADPQAAVNRLNMPREPLETFTRWVGFDE